MYFKAFHRILASLILLLSIFSTSVEVHNCDLGVRFDSQCIHVDLVLISGQDGIGRLTGGDDHIVRVIGVGRRTATV